MVIFKKRYGFHTAGILLKDWEPLEESSQIISTAGTSKVSFRKTFSAKDVPAQGLLLSEHTGWAYWLVKYAQHCFSATWQSTQDLLVSLYFYIHCCLSCCVSQTTFLWLSLPLYFVSLMSYKMGPSSWLSESGFKIELHHPCYHTWGRHSTTTMYFHLKAIESSETVNELRR